ncbi:MAG: LamG domain-containing protein [Deltaproteobacteria bacterium]|nr:LamG domain-containing protein [Deltaproteobacteria bacterium]
MLRRAMYVFARGALLSCVLFAGPAASQTCVEPAAGMLGWWPGDGDSVDLQSGLHGVALNGTGYAPGLVGEAFSFNGLSDGQDDRVDLPPSALDGLADVTIEMWVLSVADQGALISGANDLGVFTDNEMLLFQGLDGTLVFVRQLHGGALPFFVNDGAWHHLAFSRSTDIGTLYIDGVVVDSRTVPTEFFEVGPGGLMLGQEQDCLGGCFDTPQAFDGMLDELSIYDRALTDGEILAIFEAGAAGKCKPVSMDDLLLEIEEMKAEMEMLRDSLTESEAAAGECGHPGHRRHHNRHALRNDGHDRRDWGKGHWKNHREGHGHNDGRHDSRRY